MKKLSIVAAFLILFSVTLLAQSKIISKQEADQLYGKPVITIKMFTKVITSLIDTHEFIMFKIKDDKVNVLGKNRMPVINQFNIKDGDIYFVFEADELKKFLEIGASDVTYIELRLGNSDLKDGNTITDDEETTSVTNGDVTLFPAFQCPPFC